MSTGLNILCIGKLRMSFQFKSWCTYSHEDGGGVRGLSSLIILQEFMLRIENAKATGTIHPHEYFDMIAGTGTGG